MKYYYCEIWKDGKCIYKSTKGDVLLKTKKYNNSVPSSIKGDYDLSIHGNTIILIDKKNNIKVESKCHPDDTFNIEVGLKEVFDKIIEKRKEKNEKEIKENEIKVNDKVKIIKGKYIYPNYYKWLPNNNFELIKNFNFGCFEAPIDNIYKVLVIGKHEKYNNITLAYIQDKDGMCYTFDIKGLKKIK